MTGNDLFHIFIQIRLISLLIIAWQWKLFLPVIQLPVYFAEWVFVALNIVFTVFVVILCLRVLILLSLFELNAYIHHLHQY